MATKKKEQVPEKPVMEEVATTGDGHLAGLGSALHGGRVMPKDTKVLELGGKEYTRMLRDDQVQSTLQQRRLAVVSRDWSVAPGGDGPRDQEAADHLSGQLGRIGWDRVTDKMLYGLFYGYSIAEMMWMIGDAGRVEIERIVVRDRLRFRFDIEGRLRLMRRDGNADGEVMPPGKFWTFQAGADHDDELYGLGLGYHLFWPCWFKREGLASWLQGLDKTARPTGLGKFPQGANQDDIEKLLAALQAMSSDTGIAIPENMAIELLQAARSSTADYDTLYNRMDAAISKIVLSQTMTTDSSVTGLGSTQGEVHADVKREVVKADADLLNESFSCSVAKWLTDWNFPGAATPIVSRQVDDPEDLDAASTRDSTLTQIGYKPTPERIRQTYGEGYEVTEPADEGKENGDAQFSACPSCGHADFVEGGDAITRLAGDVLADEGWVPMVEPLIGPIEELLDSAENLEEVRDALIGQLSSMDATALAESIARATFNARIAGEVGADADEEALLDAAFGPPDDGQ